jgi:glycine/D-amino acid oxidase-like deaminating enzyme
LWSLAAALLALRCCITWPNSAGPTWPDRALGADGGLIWHAAGGFHALNADPNIAALQAYTIDLLSEIEKESGQSVGMHMTGGLTMAGTPDRWEWLQSAYRTFQSIGIEDVPPCHARGSRAS